MEMGVGRLSQRKEDASETNDAPSFFISIIAPFLYLLLLPFRFLIRHIPPINNRLKPGTCHLSPTIEKHTCNLSENSLNLQRNNNAFSVIRI